MLRLAGPGHRVATLLVILLAVAIVVSACGDDGKVEIEDPAPEVQPGDEIPAFDPRDYVCTVEDIPAAFPYELMESGETSHEDAAALSPNPEARLDGYGEWGRVTGQRSAFSSEALAETPEQIAYFECALDRYQEEPGARRAFDATADSIQVLSALVLGGQGYGGFEYEEIPAPRIGDETEALSGVAVRGEQIFEWYAVVFRRLNMVGYSITAAPQEFSFVEDAANISALMVTLMDQEIEARLEEQSETGED